MRWKIAAVVVCGFVTVTPWTLAQPGQSQNTVDRVPIPEGTFVMGSDRGGEADERPSHRVTLPAFRMDRTEVSRNQYNRCVSAQVCTAPRDVGPRFRGGEQPVVGVSWTQAQRYCSWTRGRLPTEREWEKAARGSDGRMFPWGNEIPDENRAVFGRPQNTGAPDAVGTRNAGRSPYGVLDMAGNVWEWTSTPYDPLAYRNPEREVTCDTAIASLNTLRNTRTQGFTGSNPLPTTCERVLRGGAWNYGSAGLRVTNRVHHPPGFQISVAGFRCADDGR
jgi:formylglycine-generating enzyme required for sulfatase activity